MKKIEKIQKNKNLKETKKVQKGITLVALVIAIIIIIILATVTINFAFGDNGLINKAEQGKVQHEIESTREELMAVLSDAMVEKQLNPEYKQDKFLDDFIHERKSKADITEDEISLNGYTFELDRSVPQLGAYIGETVNLPPRIRKIEVKESTASSIKVEVTALRTEGVIYRYLYKKEKENDYIKVGETTESIYTIENLEENTRYKVNVELIKEGKVINNEEIEASTKEVIEYVDSELPTAPKLSDGMIPVKYVDGTGWIKTTKEDAEWYNYANKEWANIVLENASWITNGNNQVLDESKAYSMLVWIPRYAYQITTNYHTNAADGGNIDIVFIDTNNQNKEKTTKYSTSYPNATIGGKMDDYVVHPAFNYGETKLNGFWVGKYETSNDISIMARQSSITSCDVSLVYTTCRELNQKGNRYGLNSDDNIVDPHMIKNSEWGAVAYLSKSKYGKESQEIWINNRYNYLTGCSGNSPDAGQNIGTTDDYKSEQGVKASTTGNVYGIYDMNGRSMGSSCRLC